MRYLLMATAAFCLSGCEPQEKRDARFVQRCEAAQFTHDQCAFLLALAKDQKSDADSNAATSAAVSAAALSLATTARR